MGASGGSGERRNDRAGMFGNQPLSGKECRSECAVGCEQRVIVSDRESAAKNAPSSDQRDVRQKRERVCDGGHGSHVKALAKRCVYRRFKRGRRARR